MKKLVCLALCLMLALSSSALAVELAEPGTFPVTQEDVTINVFAPVSSGSATGCDVAVFTAMCMCWSGYLSTHVAMMNNLKHGKLIGRAIAAHTVGGLCAGVAAHWLFRLISLI